MKKGINSPNIYKHYEYILNIRAPKYEANINQNEERNTYQHNNSMILQYSTFNNG
jgi:hypothetical protein